MTTLAMDSPVRDWMAWATASAVNTMLRWASMASRLRLNMGLASRSDFDIRNDFSTFQRSWYFAMTSVAGISDTGALVT